MKQSEIKFSLGSFVFCREKKKALQLVCTNSRSNFAPKNLLYRKSKKGNPPQISHWLHHHFTTVWAASVYVTMTLTPEDACSGLHAVTVCTCCPLWSDSPWPWPSVASLLMHFIELIKRSRFSLGCSLAIFFSHGVTFWGGCIRTYHCMHICMRVHKRGTRGRFLHRCARMMLCALLPWMKWMACTAHALSQMATDTYWCMRIGLQQQPLLRTYCRWQCAWRLHGDWWWHSSWLKLHI